MVNDRVNATGKPYLKLTWQALGSNRVKQMVKKRLKDEGWIVSGISYSTESKKDL